MQYLALYLVILLSFGALDAIWLSSTIGIVYKPTLGDILLPTPKYEALVAFYLMYPAALVIFAAIPSMKAGSLTQAFVCGALFGLFAYATYNLTNLTTLRNWTVQLSMIDVSWGTVASGTATAIACLVAMKLGWWTGR